MNTIRMPVLTEKSIMMYKLGKKVTFEVDGNVNKKDAVKALESTYGVKVENVKVNNRVGKYKMNRTNRKTIKNPDKKFMVFKIAEKDKIEIFEEASK